MYISNNKEKIYTIEMKQTKKNTQKKHTTHTNILVHDC